MDLKLTNSSIKQQLPLINITGSKSESNRLLILQALFPEFEVENLSNSDDTQVLLKALNEDEKEVDIHHAGTAMRFLTAYFSVIEGKEVLLTGSSRMKERPIGVLVEALRELGADISYDEKEGYPPLRIKGKKIFKNKVTLKANISSQYISALLLIAGSLDDGLTLELDGEITSVPYIKMTLNLMKSLGIDSSFIGNTIKVYPKGRRVNGLFTVESDWSSVSYFYSIIALSPKNTSITIGAYKEDSLQGDSCLAEIYNNFGVTTLFNNNTITLTKTEEAAVSRLELDLVNAPDIAQTIAVTCFGLSLGCDLYGLHTLKIKETDRLVALKNELEKLGGKLIITEKSLHLEPSVIIHDNVTIATYQDHRMAMAFAPLALKATILINESEVVSKSYPQFWRDMNLIGISSLEI